MTTLFDSDVRLRRTHTPWARISISAFMKEMALNVPYDTNYWEHQAILKVHYRHSVASRFWWSLEWTGEDGERHSVDSQELDLLFWRAAEMEMRIRKKIEAKRDRGDGQAGEHSTPTTQGPADPPEKDCA